MKQRPDGRWVKVKTIDGKKVSFYSTAKTERAAIKDIESQLLSFTARKTVGISFAEIAAEWWEEAEPELAIQSVSPYRSAHKRAVEWFGDKLIRDITPKDIERRLCEMGNLNFAQKTVSNQKTVINQIFKYAITHGDVVINPCASAQLPKKLKKTKRSSASVEDEKKVKENIELWLFPYIALMTGMRKGEILALQWRDIDFDNNVISVTKSVCHKFDRPYIKEPKTAAGYRVIPLLLELKDVLLNVSPRKANDYIISDDGKKPLTNKRYSTLMEHYTRETGIKCTAHQLRHSFATIAFEAGVQPKAVQQILGHSQLSTTMDIYTDVRKKALDEAALLLNQMSRNKA